MGEFMRVPGDYVKRRIIAQNSLRARLGNFTAAFRTQSLFGADFPPKAGLPANSLGAANLQVTRPLVENLRRKGFVF